MSNADSTAELLRESAVDFFAGQVTRERLRNWMGRPRPVDRTLWRQVAELGWTSALLPESLGGSGLALGDLLGLIEQSGRALFAEPLVACAVLPALLLAHVDSQRAAPFAQILLSGERQITLAWQDAVGQIQFDAPACELKEGHLSGRKRFVPACEHDGVLLVWAQRDGEPVLIALDVAADGVERTPIAVGLGSHADLRFDRVAVNESKILLKGDAARQALTCALAGARLALAAELCGAAAGCLAQTLEHLRNRRQFDRAIGSFQSVQHRCVDLHIEIELAGASWRHALNLYDADPLSAVADAAICAAKARAGDAAERVARESVQLHGAMGFCEEVDIGLYLRHALHGRAWLGSSGPLRRRFARHADQARFADRGAAAKDAQGSVPVLVRGEDRNAWTDDHFRLAFRGWLAEHYPAHWRQTDQRPFLRLRGDDLRKCMRLLDDHGWRAPAWPREFGGMGLSFRKQWIYAQEWDRAGGARTVEPGETHLAPTLFRWGTAEQRAQLLPRILRCDDLWVQGYSEPGAGSDLASLRTRAVREGDHYVVNGQKIWTTQAAESSHVFALVRTGTYEKKQQGISFMLIDLKSPGVRIRPIVNLAGDDELCEVFFDDVRVPADQIVGEVDQGWQVAKSLLGHERLWLGSPAMAQRALGIAERLVQELDLAADLGVTDRLAALQADLHDYRCLYTALCNRVADHGTEPGGEASVLKIYVSELLQRIVQFSVEVAGESGAQTGDLLLGDWPVDLHWPYMMARPTTIYAGCNEVQRDIVAKSVLQLPSAR